MTTHYSLQFLWSPDDRQRAGVGPLNFTAKTRTAALRQARQLWEVQPFDREARGYRLLQQDTGATVYEYWRLRS